MQVNIYSTKFRIKSNEITFPQNAVNVDTLTDDMVPSQSQVGSSDSMWVKLPFLYPLDKFKFNHYEFYSVHAMTFISQTDFVGIQGILDTGDLGATPSPQDLALEQMYQRDSSLCLQK